MKRRTQIVLAGAVLVGMAAISSMKRGANPGAGSRGRGVCCPLMSGVNLLATNLRVAVGSTNGKAVVTSGEVTTNRKR